MPQRVEDTIQMLLPVFLCSPFRGNRELHDSYLRDALRDSLSRGEAPFAPHALYPQVLDDSSEAERQQGIEAGKRWLEMASKIVVYADLGVSDGMLAEIELCRRLGMPVQYRALEQYALVRTAAGKILTDSQPVRL